ncbi:transposase [Acidiferrobacter thiooxydans]|nr:transposase [Acidiferrobacter thiooxydans]
MDEVRAEEARALVRNGREPVLKKSRWCLLKRSENLTTPHTRGDSKSCCAITSKVSAPIC